MDKNVEKVPEMKMKFGLVIAYVGFTVCLYFIGMYYFATGFLLTRHEMTTKSSCRNDDCRVAPHVNTVYTRTIVIIIDALRFDFAEYKNDSRSHLPYINKLPVLRELALEKGCSGARLFRFQADAPTTTMQRIKGFTTGSFPTFVDISNNFDSAEITEDNIIDQLRRQGKRLTFMGDDTWMNLFPNRFKRTFPFPSFDVKDLHTVDNGVLRHIYKEMKKSHWDFIIAHFLGVDHCGHRYGPVHPEMKYKLRQMNQMIRRVVDGMRNDTLLVVMGDHGMTETGDHGGATPNEVDTTLFVYSPAGALYSPSDTEFDTNCYDSKVQQVDIVPTLSLLFGSPIPFPNLGTFIPAFVPGTNRDEQEENLKEMLKINLMQIQRYLKEYNRLHQSFPQESFQNLSTDMGILTNKNTNSTQVEDYFKLMRLAREMCREIWAQFDELSMVIGLHLCTTFTLWHSLNPPLLIVFGPMFLSYAVSFLNYFGVSKEVLGNMMFFMLVFGIISSVARVTVDKEKPLQFLPQIAIVVFYGAIYTANSFILNEDRTICYLFLTMQGYMLVRLIRNSNKRGFNMRFKAHTPTWRKIMHFCVAFHKEMFSLGIVLCVALLFVTRFSFIFRICRPEQFWCYKNSSEVKFSVEETDWANFWKPVMSVASLVGIILLVWKWFSKSGNMNCVLSPSRVCCKSLLPLTVVFIAFHWMIQTISSSALDDLPDLYITLLPRCAYVLLLICALWWIISPVTSVIIHPNKKGASSNYNPDIQSHYLYKLKRYHLDRKTENRNVANKSAAPAPAPPAAFGIHHILSTGIIGFTQVLLILFALLLDVEVAPVMFFFVISIGFLLEIIALDRRFMPPSESGNWKVTWSAVALWSLSSSFWWFATGHQGGISSIPWNAAFVGFRGNHPTVAIPGLMVILNIFASQILHTLLLPLVVIWPITHAKPLTHDQRDIGNELEFLQSDYFWPAITDSYMKYILLQSVKMIGCMLAGFLHRRHLMVWWIFAPRYLYESISFIVTGVSSVLCLFLLQRFRYTTACWVIKELGDGKISSPKK